MNAHTSKRNHQRGYTLAEVLVATAIFTVIFVAALMIYDRSNQVFKRSVEASDMQQSTRVAFDQLAADLRMTGFDFDRDGRPLGLVGIQPWQPSTTYVIGNVVQPNPPNGHAYIVTVSGESDATPPTWPEATDATVTEPSGLEWKEKGILQYQQPDEQLEHMGATAVTLRGNLDYESDAATDYGRETDLESTHFPVVTTANDEIVTYALKSQDASKNTDEIVFFADTFEPRQVNPEAGEAEKEVTITGVDLSNQNPPYTLYRFTLKEDGTPDAGTPLADNIRSLNFRYFRDTAGTLEATPNGGAGQYDGANPGETVERQLRREIRAIHVDLVGMNPQPDMAYTHPTDTVAPHYRQYRLESMIVPRNLGRRGMKELSVEPPGKPVIKTVCMGSCDVAYVTWEPPIKGDVITYNVMYDVDNVGGYELEDVGNTIEAYVGKYLIPNTTFYFKVQAINPHGFATSDDTVSIKNINKTTPESPATAVATGGADPAYPAEPNQIRIAWPQVTENTDAAKTLTCADGSTREQKAIPGNEQINYRLYRNTDPAFTPAAADLILDENSTTQPVFSGTNLVFTDANAANCVDYYYRVQAVDGCVGDPSYNDPANVSTAMSTFYPPVGTNAVPGEAVTTVAPGKVMNVTKLDESCAGMSANCDAEFGWTEVTADVNGNPAQIVEYEVVVEKLDTVTGTWLNDATVGSPIQVLNAQRKWIIGLNKLLSYRVSVSAVQCGVKGEASEWHYWPCDFTAVASVTVPVNYGGAGTSASPYIINSPASLEVNVDQAVSKIEVWSGSGGGATSYANPALPAVLPIPATTADEAVPIYVNVTLAASGCSKLFIVWVEDQSPPPCPGAVISSANLGTNIVNLTLNNISSQDLTIERIKIVWNRNETPSPNQADITSVKFEGVSSTSKTFDVLTNPLWTEVWEAPLATVLEDTDSAFPIELGFVMSGNKTLVINPVKQICIEYTNVQTDTLLCGVTEPGSVQVSCTFPN
ncbi:MAG: prepilin-type N-terminal cleavage/methylation domain-containing protein [Thermoanaerobaculia bacterium]